MHICKEDKSLSLTGSYITTVIAWLLYMHPYSIHKPVHILNYHKVRVGHGLVASQPYFPPCAHARMISAWGEGRVW